MTIEIPIPSADLISQVETATIEAHENVTQAVAALRERLTPYAKHNGNIKIAAFEASTCNWSVDRSIYYRDAAGQKAKGLLACDKFGRGREDQNRGSLSGKRLYLLATGEWLEIEREGSWSAWQGSPVQWGCGHDASPNSDYDNAPVGGYTQILSDAEVAANWNLFDILNHLAESMSEMATKLPSRYSKLKQRAEVAQRVLAALKQEVSE